MPMNIFCLRFRDLIIVTSFHVMVTNGDGSIMKIQHEADPSQFYIVKDEVLSQGNIKFDGVSRNLMLLL